MSYKITIEKTTRERKVVDGRWEATVTIAEKTEYGYAPSREESVEKTTEVYSQVVEELDLVAVIEAVNKKARK